jgi:hypothetical protein
LSTRTQLILTLSNFLSLGLYMELHFFPCAKTDLLQCCEAQASRSNAPLY